ncbi:MAG: hypothetical protein ACT443_06485 [Gemmatimonadota bacterium]
MSEQRRARVERVIVGVLRQACADARTDDFTLIGDTAAARYVDSLCKAAGGRAGVGLTVAAASKTALLLGAGPVADVLPLGDLYCTQIEQLIGVMELPPELAELAKACGGAETLDRVLELHFDERRTWQSAVAELTFPVREQLKQRLDAARFRRTRVGIVPKLGSRTLGIDLYA